MHTILLRIFHMHLRTCTHSLTPQEAGDFVMRRAIALAEVTDADALHQIVSKTQSSGIGKYAVDQGDNREDESTKQSCDASDDEANDELCEMTAGFRGTKKLAAEDPQSVLQQLADALVQKALAKGSLDNVSVVLVDLSGMVKKEQL